MEQQQIYRQIPLASPIRRCIICNRRLREKRDATVVLYNRDKKTDKCVQRQFLYCYSCDICYISDKSECPDLAEGDYFPSVFDWGHASLGSVYAHSLSYPKWHVGFKHIGDSNVHSPCGLKEVYLKGKPEPLTLHICNAKLNTCPVCGQGLKHSSVNIPISTITGVKYGCVTCGAHWFVFPSKRLKAILKDNHYSSNITVSFKYYYKTYALSKDLFENDSKHFMMLLLKSSTDNAELSLIISNYSNSYGKDIQIADYKTDDVRKLLADILKHRKSSVSYQGKNFDSIVIISPYDKRFNSLVSDITIKSRGGLYESVLNNNYELVDVLLYSPFTERYEIARATNYFYTCYMDISLYKQFCRNYGKPDVYLNFYEENHSGRKSGDYSYLKEESIIHAFGYNVNAQDDLSDAYRHQILADVMDLELITAKGIISLLESLIRRSARYPYACSKWEKDIKFVTNYKVNPQRFLIGNKIFRK